MENIEMAINEATPVVEEVAQDVIRVIPEPKKMGFGAKAVIGMVAAAGIAAGVHFVMKWRKDQAKKKAREEADARGYDNIDIAKRDHLDIVDESVEDVED